MSRGDCRAAPCSTRGTWATSKRDMSCPTATKLSGRWRWAEGQRGPPGSSHANVPALHPSPHPPPGSTFPFSCLSPAEKTNTPEIRAILAEPREQSPLSETRGCLPKPRARQMGETALSGSPSQGHMSYSTEHTSAAGCPPKQRGCSLVASIPSRIRGSLPSSGHGHKHLQLPVPTQHPDTRIWDHSRA